MLIGSCFTEYVGQKLRELYFPVRVNPAGILYNPGSVAVCLENILDGRIYEEKDLFQHQGVWHSPDHHGRFSDPDKKRCLEKINRTLQDTIDHLPGLHFLILTLGTAWVYEWKETGSIVANNHKLPASRFHRRLMDPEEIQQLLGNVLKEMAKQVPGMKVILTVSPVRHLRDGAVENNVSKASLLLAVHRLVKKYTHITYFPSYELALDDLRDYRFYADDLVHPNNQMIDYIWEKFSETYFSTETREMIEEFTAYNKLRSHRPLFAGSEETARLRQKIEQQKKELLKKYPGIDLK